MRGKAALQMLFFTIRQCLKIYVIFYFFFPSFLSAYKGETFGGVSGRGGAGWGRAAGPSPKSTAPSANEAFPESAELGTLQPVLLGCGTVG